MTMSHEDPVQHTDGRSTKALHVEDTEYWSTRCGMRGEYSNHGARQARPEKGPDTRDEREREPHLKFSLLPTPPALCSWLSGFDLQMA